MKKTYNLLSACLLLLVGLFAAAMPAKAQLSFAEDFNYPSGTLTEQSGGKWFTYYSYYKENPIQVSEETLSVDGCPIGATSHYVTVKNQEDNESLVRLFDESDRGISDKTIWLAAYVNVEKEPGKHTPFLSFVGRTMTQDVTENNVPYYNGHITYGPGTTTGKYRLGVTYNRNYAPKASMMTADLDYGTTHLVVAKFVLDGKGNEQISLYVDPTDYQAEPATGCLGPIGSAYGMTDKGYGYKAVMLNQNLSYGYTSGSVKVGALHVSDSYAGLFTSASGGGETSAATLEAAFNGSVPTATVKQGEPFKGELTVSGKDLTSDVTLKADYAGLQFDRTSLPAAEVMAEGGVKVGYTLNYLGSEESEELTTKVTVESEGAKAAEASFTWTGAAAATPAEDGAKFKEDFKYPAGDLTTQSAGKWFSAVSYYTKNPIQVSEGKLSVDGCPLGTTDHVVTVNNAEDNQSLMRLFDESDRGISDKTIWLAAYVNVEKEPGKHTPFLSFVGRTMTQDVTENNVPYHNGHITYGPGTTADKYRLGVTYNRNYAPKDNMMTADLDYGTTHLVVAKLVLDGKGNEQVSLYVDPTDYTAEPTTGCLGPIGSAYGMTDKGYGYKAVMLNQNLSYGYTPGCVKVGALRVSDSYASLFAGNTGGGETPEPTAELHATFAGTAPQVVFKGLPVKGELTLTGKDLTSDVTLSSDNEALQFERTTVPAAEVTAEGGVKVPFTMTYNGSEPSEEFTTKVSVACEGAAAVDTTFTWYGGTTREITSVKDFQGVDPDAFEALLFKGHAVVSYVDKATSTYYLQDAEGGVTLTDEYEMVQSIDWVEGDSVKPFVCYVEESMGANFIYPAALQVLTASAHDQKVEPAVVTIDELKANATNYLNRLVTVKNVTLSGFEEGAKFAEGMTQPTYTDADGNTGKVRIFKQTSLIGTAIPTGKVHLTGLLTSKAVTNGPIVAPRGVADVMEAVDPSFEIDNTQFLKARGKVGSTTAVGTVHVKSVAQEKEITIVPSGAVEGIYAGSVSTIPAGNFEGDVTINYTPRKIGKDKGNLYFMQGDDILATVKIEGMATDPNDPPAVSLKPSSLSKEFTAYVGEEMKDTILVTPYGMPDYVKVATESSVDGTFITSSSLLMTSGEQKLVITFRPTSAGTFTGKVTISNEFIDPIVLRLTGVAMDKPVVPSKEGDELPLSTENPLTSFNELFTDGVHNKPLSLNGWKNLAMEGTRAWWGYTFPDYDTDNAGEHAAKVTAYDSKVETGNETPCQMLLVTPALDFENAKSKYFTFRVMGQNMTDDMTDQLELCYIWLDGEEMHVEPIKGVGIPASKDQNGEWVDFQVDLTGQNIDPVFFMGFRFTSERGTAHSAVYYVDDVTFGSTTLPMITTDRQEVIIQAEPETPMDSEPVEVTAENLTQPVKLALEGADKDHFALSEKELSAEGGQFTIRFKGAPEGDYAIYVNLSSRGAVTKRIIVEAQAHEGITGITTAEVTDQTVVEMFDASGRQLSNATGATFQKVFRTLPAGTYVVRFHTAQGVRSVKMIR